MKKIVCVLLLFVLFAGILIAADALYINRSTIYKVEKAALYTTSLNQLQIIVKYCVSASTRIYLDERPVDLSALKPGFRVIVYYKDGPCATVMIKAYSR